VEESKLALDQEMEQATSARALATTEAVSTSVVAVVEPAESAIVAAASVVEPIALESSAIESGSVNTSTVQESELAAVPAQSAYAAAAGAEHTTPIAAVSTTVAVPESHASAPVDSAPPREAELAAAWQNWKQIRESLAGSPPADSQPPAAGAEVPAELAEAATPEQAESADAAPEPLETEGVAGEAREESTTIASIVDSMLAELRPKLLEEIAKKLNSEKKEKEKKKKK
jgi:hypothetical protein